MSRAGGKGVVEMAAGGAFIGFLLVLMAIWWRAAANKKRKVYLKKEDDGDVENPEERKPHEKPYFQGGDQLGEKPKPRWSFDEEIDSAREGVRLDEKPTMRDGHDAQVDSARGEDQEDLVAESKPAPKVLRAPNSKMKLTEPHEKHGTPEQKLGDEEDNEAKVKAAGEAADAEAQAADKIVGATQHAQVLHDRHATAIQQRDYAKATELELEIDAPTKAANATLKVVEDQHSQSEATHEAFEFLPSHGWSSTKVAAVEEMAEGGGGGGGSSSATEDECRGKIGTSQSTPPKQSSNKKQKKKKKSKKKSSKKSEEESALA